MALLSPLLLPGHAPEEQPNLLASPSKLRLVARVPHVAAEAEQGESLLATALKVITCGLGAGILVLPWGAAGASLLTSHAITAAVLAANAWTIMIIVHAVDAWGGSRVWDETHSRWVGSRRRPGYRIDDLGQLLRQAPQPLPALVLLWDVTVNVSSLGALIGYMIVTGDAMRPLMSNGCTDLADRKPWILMGSLICLPLCWADLAWLKYSSAVGIAANVYLFFILLRAGYSQGLAEDTCLLGAAPGALACMSNLVFAIVLQMCIPEYYTQLRRDDQTPDKFLRFVLIPSFTFIFFLMCAFSTVGYLVFGHAVSANVLKNLPEDAFGKSTQIAICVACLMVYPCMLRPMVQPVLRGAELLASLDVSKLLKGEGGDFPKALFYDSEDVCHDIYEGRLIHTELVGPIEVDTLTGEATLPVADTCGFEKDALIFVDGLVREFAVIKQVYTAPKSPDLSVLGDPLQRLPKRAGSLTLRPRFGADANWPVTNESGNPACALEHLRLPSATKVVLDEDPVLVTAAIAGESCLHLNAITGLGNGSRIVVGEGARAERHRVVYSSAFTPEPESIQGHVRTHDLVLGLGGELRHNHGAHTRVAMDHGPTEAVATAIVVTVLLVSLWVEDLGLVNVINGAISVAIIVGVVPGLCALALNTQWKEQAENSDASAMPLCFRHRAASLSLVFFSVAVGFACMFFTDNHALDMESHCTWTMKSLLAREDSVGLTR